MIYLIITRLKFHESDDFKTKSKPVLVQEGNLHEFQGKSSFETEKVFSLQWDTVSITSTLEFKIIKLS